MTAVGPILLAAALAVGCGSPRHVVIEPEAVGARKADTWHVTSEPGPGPAHGAPDAPAATTP